MNAEGRLRFFPFQLIDYKAAEVWLNAQAAEGWALDGFRWGWFAHMVPSGRSDLAYCVELPTKKELEDWDYLALCREAGWETAALWGRHMRIFRSLPGTDPAPLQTEPRLELDRLLRKRLLPDLAASAVLMALFGLFFVWLALSLRSGLSGFWSTALLRLLSSAYGCYLLLFFLFLLPYSLWMSASSLQYWRQCRRAKDSGEPFPIPTQPAARRRGRWQAAYFLLYLVYFGFLALNLLLPAFAIPSGGIYDQALWPRLREQPVVMAWDLGLDDTNTGNCWLEENSSPFLRHISFLDPTSGGIRQEYYACATAGLAGFTADVLRAEASANPSRPITLRPVALGFDESWTAAYPDGETQALLLRQGKTVVLLTGGVDWMAPAVLPTLWDRLALIP